MDSINDSFPAMGDAGADGDRRRGFRGTQENAKTKLCLRWKSGHCRFGDSCNFAHGEEELRQLPARGGQGGGRGQGLGPSTPIQMSKSPKAGNFQQSRSGQGSYGSFGSGPAQRTTSQEEIYAQQGYPVRGPNGWTQYTTQDTKEQYYHNSRTQETVWDRPPEWPLQQ